MTERDSYIDFLRFVGITLIVIAHVNAPFTITQIRSFDVPLMVFVSGLSFSGKEVSPSWASFYYPRIKRLLIPVYFFLSIYFLGWLIIGKPDSVEEVLGSYLLLESPSIGFVWIIKVFLLIMVLTPWLIKLNKRFNMGLFLLLILMLLALQEIIVLAYRYYSPVTLIGQFTKESFSGIAGYSIPFLFGLRFRNVDNKIEQITLVSVSFLFLISAGAYICQYGCPIEISPRFKYPPYRYFIVYGTGVSVILWILRNYLKVFSSNKFVLFVGRNTIWIYLWHIPFVYIANRFIDGWVIRYCIAYIGAILCFSLQFFVVEKVRNRYSLKVLKYFIG